jgi:amino acid adenylation domain-containing protein
MSGHYVRLLEEAVKSPCEPISALPMLGPEEIDRILYEWNNTGTEYPKDKTIHGLFEEQVERTPGHIAVIDSLMQLSYLELDERSNRLSKYLRSQGIRQEEAIGIMSGHSVETVIGILAILKAGGAYLPIDPDYPQERIDFMLKDSGAEIIVGNRLACSAHIEPSTVSRPPATSLAYIIYTSGSTGRPKGVMINHRSVVRLVKNTNYIEFKPGDRILQTGALEFDASTFEIWGSLLNGLTLYIVSKDVILTPEKLKTSIRRYGITVMWMTSPLFNQMAQADIEIFAGLKNFLVGGDVLSPAHIGRLRRRYPRLNVIDGYGPTENTTFSTTFLIEKEYKGNIPIGKPIANSTVYIVDKYNNPQPVGVAGELFVGGDGVSRGYLNDPELTAEKFSSARLYKTGDLARWQSEGVIEFLGRMDSQVKIRGYRVELRIDQRSGSTRNRSISIGVYSFGKGDRGIGTAGVFVGEITGLYDPVLFCADGKDTVNSQWKDR